MTTSLVAFLVAFAAGAGVTALMPRVAFRLGAVDRPDGYRKIHARAIPRLGGIGVFAGFLAPLVILLIGFPANLVVKPILEQLPGFLAILAGALVVLAMGARDDVRPLRPGLKFLCQVLASLIAMAGGLIIWRVNLPVAGEFGLGPAAIPLTLFWFLGCMNAINLLDGMDALAGGMSLLVCVTLALTGWFMGNTTGMLMMASLAGSILGFLIFNFHPARIFLGDSGSNVIGFLIAALALVSSRTSERTVALVVPVLALGVPIIDTGLAIVRRWSKHLPLSAPDRQHIHHRLLSMGLTQRRTVLILYGICAMLCAGALLTLSEHREILFLVLGAVAILVYVCVRILGGTHLAALGARFGRDWRLYQAGSEARTEVERCAHAAAAAATVEALWASLGKGFAALHADEARFRLTHPADAPREFLWRSSDCPGNVLDAPGDLWHIRLAVRWGAAETGVLQLFARVPGDALFVPDRVGLGWHLRDLLAANLARIFAQPQPAEAAGEAPRAAESTPPWRGQEAVRQAPGTET